MVKSLSTMVDKHIKEQVEKQERGRLQAEISLQIQQAIDNNMPSLVDASVRNYMSGHILHVHPAQPQTTYVPEQQYQLTSVVHLRDQDDPHDDTTHEEENNAKRQKTSEYEAHVTGDSSEQTESYDSDDDEIAMKKVSQDIMEEVSLTINEVELKKIANEMLRQRCTSGDEHQYHIDQMKNFLKSDIVWESRKEILVSPHPRKTTPLVQSCQRDPEAPPLSLINQDLLYLKKGSSGPEKIVLSLHKFPAIIFNDDDIEERTSRWVNKCVKKFNPYARYGVEHWKNPHAKIFYIRKQKEPGKPKEVIYSNSKIIQVIKTYWELGHEHKFITEIVARRANECIVSITEPDYKNLNKNDIEDMYLLIMNGKVPDYAETGLLWSLSVFIRSSVIWERVHDFQLGIESYQQKVNLTAPTISFPGVEKHKMFSIIYEPVHGIIYKNSKKEKRVMRHSEIHKFCDATLIRVLEGLKSYNNDVKYGYVQRELTNDEVEYLKLFEEEIEVRLKYRNQMRRWDILKRAEDELEQENVKKQKVDEDKETVELQSLMEVVLDEEEVAIDVVPLATKPPTIVDCKIHKKGKKSYYQIIRADGKPQMYRVFSQMLKSFSSEYLEDLYKLTMFKLHVEDQVWKNQDNYSVLDWKLYDSCGVHSLRMQHVCIHMLVEKRYPLTPATITDMLNKKLQVDYLNEMAYQLLKLLTKQLKNQ
ncbi:hypothetical protein Tco_0652199 [Tanacetum coccineum]|uniref:Uncharacterized protein n=1 Tax=Tanacetum coccineum TaxID=301880 RepID=A0ABQ4WXI7_9ASTR